MRENFQGHVIRLMGRRQFEERSKNSEDCSVFRKFGDIRMVAEPFAEKTGEEKTKGEKEKTEPNLKYKFKTQKNESAVIYDFNCIKNGSVAEKIVRYGYGGRICNYEDAQSDFDYILRATSKILPPRLFATEHIADVDILTCGDYFSDSNIFNSIEKFKKLSVPENGYRLTNTGWKYGAVAAFYPGVLKRIGMLLKQDFYIAFPSPDEARIHPVLYTDVRQIGRAIRKSNKELMREAPGDIITDKVYRYCRNIKMLREVEFYEW